MYMTKREQAMQFAEKQGYDAYPYGVLPQIYSSEEAKHLATAWQAGYDRHRQENQLGW